MRAAERLWITALGLVLAACSDSSGQAVAAPEPDVTVTPAGSLDIMASAAQTAEQRADPYADFAAVLLRHQRMNARVERISHRLRVANAPLCKITRPDVGLSSHSLSDYPKTLRLLALHFMDLGPTGRFVRDVVPGSPADQADIRRGDRIVSGWPVSDRAPLVIDAGSGSFPVALTTDRACDIPAFVVSSDTPNASTDGREIDLSSALVEQVGDDHALAFIVAHEMAHVLRGHQPDAPGWDVELQADRDALVLMANAGFDVAGTVDGWAAGVEAHRESQRLSMTHPPVSIRLANLQKALGALPPTPRELLRLGPESD